jgi:hypothetical protein
MSDLVLRSGVGVYHRAALRADPLAASRRTACESVCCVHPSRRLLRKLLRACDPIAVFKHEVRSYNGMLDNA